jgi:hypothetical protein
MVAKNKNKIQYEQRRSGAQRGESASTLLYSTTATVSIDAVGFLELESPQEVYLVGPFTEMIPERKCATQFTTTPRKKAKANWQCESRDWK